MVTKVQKWGNSQGLRLTRHVLDNARIAIGDDVEIIVGEEQITIRQIARPRFNLAKMVARLPSRYKAREESFGKTVGLEEW